MFFFFQELEGKMGTLENLVKELENLVRAKNQVIFGYLKQFYNISWTISLLFIGIRRWHQDNQDRPSRENKSNILLLLSHVILSYNIIFFYFYFRN